MEAYEQRIVNGMLKTSLAANPDEALRLLHRDIEVIGSADRVVERDLWPAVWALCSALERQFTGKIYINVGLKAPLGQPARLGERCFFADGRTDTPHMKIFLGCRPDSPDATTLVGDARGAGISYGSLLSDTERATPASCFALAGYLGFAALASAVGIPPFRQDLTWPDTTLPYKTNTHNGGIGGITFLGLGHLGQAYLALLYFQRKEIDVSDRIALLDGGNFEDGNWHTQVLIEDGSDWLGVPKAIYLSDRLRIWGLKPVADQITLNWGWSRLSTHPETAILGFDNFPARRMAAAAGYSRLVEAGLGDSFVQPRLTWHSIPSDVKLANKLFPDRVDSQPAGVTSAFVQDLRSRPGCGEFVFNQIQASAPCMGLLASAFVWSELLRMAAGHNECIRGSAALWSAILPYLREQIH